MDRLIAHGIETLQKRLEMGETTNNPIADHFLRWYSIIDEEVAKPLHELEKQMKGKKGQLFLVAWKKRERHRFGGDSQATDYHLKTVHVMGVLSDEKLVFCENQQGTFVETGRVYGLSTEKYVEVGMNLCTEGSFLFPFMRGIHAPNEIEVGSQTETEFEVIIGDDDVLGHQLGGFRSDTWTGMLESAAQALGKNV